MARRVVKLVFAVVSFGLACFVPATVDVPDQYFHVAVLSSGTLGLVASLIVFPWVWERIRSLNLQSTSTVSMRSSWISICGASICGSLTAVLNPAWKSWIWACVFPVLIGSVGLSFLAFVIGVVSLAINRDRRGLKAIYLSMSSCLFTVAVLVGIAFMQLGKHPV